MLNIIILHTCDFGGQDSLEVAKLLGFFFFVLVDSYHPSTCLFTGGCNS
jgi:hypothetical protein